MNGVCEMERKETTQAMRCWGVYIKWKRNETLGFEVRYERSSLYAMVWMNVYTASIWINQLGIFLFSATSTGWWGNEEMHEVLLGFIVIQMNAMVTSFFYKAFKVICSKKLKKNWIPGLHSVDKNHCSQIPIYWDRTYRYSQCISPWSKVMEVVLFHP